MVSCCFIGLFGMSGSGPEWCKLPEDLVKYLETGTFLGDIMFFMLQVGSRCLGIYDSNMMVLFRFSIFNLNVYTTCILSLCDH